MSDAKALPTWCLPGETVKTTFEGVFGFYPVDTRGKPLCSDALDTNLAGPVPETTTATGAIRLDHNNPNDTGSGPRSKSRVRGAQDTSDIPLDHIQPGKGHRHQQHHAHHGHGHQQHHSRSRTYPHGTASSSYDTHSTSSQPGPHSLTRLVITNFRLCSLPPLVADQDSIRLQVTLGSIASLAMQGCQITITLKFDSSQYIISQAPQGPLQIVDVLTTLRRVVFNEDTKPRFPFLMGWELLGADTKEGLGVISGHTQHPGNTKKGSLWTAEDIIAPLSDSEPEQPGHQQKNGSQTKELQRTIKLGWDGGFNLRQEFERLQYDKNLWTVAHVNADYELSPTYPERFIMPAAFLGLDTKPFSNSQTTGLPPKTGFRPQGQSSGPNAHNQYPPVPHRYPPTQPSLSQPEDSDACLRQLAAFRSNRRFPIICWKAPDSGLVLMRSAQPMVGFLGARGPEDELYIRTVLNTACREHQLLHGNKITPRLCIMDARAYSSAVANGYLGGGRENPDHYPNGSISYMSLGNIHVISSSHQALLKAVSTQSDSPNWYSVIESTGWLTHVADVLKAAAGRDGVVGRMLEGHSSVLVHCTDGWDRTTQLVSLAQILLDPYYRTINGLRVLIEKEWLSCGHPFHSRTEVAPNQKKPSTPTTDEESSESWKSGANAIHSSPNGAKESLSYSRKWLNRVYGEQDTRLDPKPIPSFSYHIDSQQQQENMPRHTSTPFYANHPFPEPLSSNQTRGSPAFSEQGSSQQQQQRHSTTPVNAQTVPISPSPVFLLFLTCVHHIVQQHPDQFEFNDYLLLVLARAASGFSPFGDFLFNSERERAQERLRERSPSIWKWIRRNRGWFTNRDFIPDDEPTMQNGSSSLALWREKVLQVQTGGRYTTLWSEYYFNTTPTWYPDTRTVLSTPLYLYGRKGREAHQVLRRQQHQQHHAWNLPNSWWSSRFDQNQLQMLTFPGLSPQQQQHTRTPLPSLADGPVPARVTTIPPGLALLRGEEMYTYYMLAQHLRATRRRQVEKALLAWREWTKERKETKSVQEAGWILSGVSEESSSQEDGALDHHDDSEDDDDEDGSDSDDQVTAGANSRTLPNRRSKKRSSIRRSPPELKIVAARKGIRIEMERIMEGEPFFGEGPVQHEDETDEEPEPEPEQLSVEAGMKAALGTRMENLRDIRLGMMTDLQMDDLDESFDDFGFPVSLVQVNTAAVARV
ncbi:Myotubularin- protein 3 [Linnemannia elongata]|nr:Myotubularin- protein 3 [Linnemannia elongata]